MKEIKSVRVRPKFSSGDDNRGLGDYKVILFDNGKNKFKVAAGQIGRVFINAEYKREGKFENYTDDDFIKDGISILISKQNNNKEFEIIQDPWLDNPPKWRSYGYDPYYLNNGSQVYINWLDGSLSAGGNKWSDDNGKELKISKNGDDTKGFLTKIVTIWAPDSYKGKNRRLKVTQLGIKNTLDKDGRVTDFNDETKYSGLMSDEEIIKSIISRWNSQVPNYNVSLCEPEFRRCEIIPYISPDEELFNIEEKLEETSQEPSIEKEKLNVIIPKDLKPKVKEDISFKIFLGDPPKSELPASIDFNFGDEDDLSDLLLDDEFKESDFAGLDESQLEIQEYPDEKTRIETENQAQLINSQPYVPGKYTLDIIPGAFLGNNKENITCCNIDGKPVNIKIADAVLDMKAAAKKDGVNLLVTSGFRPGFSPSINTKSQSGVKITAQSQEELYKQNCAGKSKCSPATAGAGKSKHGNGIAVDFNTGSRGGAIKSPLNASVYSWLVKNSWRFGFVRTVASEEWHFEYWADKSKSGPYAVLPKSNNLFYSDLGLNNLQIA
jgi:LAS superfamily LD-carboxypeptidase LdcB